MTIHTQSGDRKLARAHQYINIVSQSEEFVCLLRSFASSPESQTAQLSARHLQIRKRWPCSSPAQAHSWCTKLASRPIWGTLTKGRLGGNHGRCPELLPSRHCKPRPPPPQPAEPLRPSGGRDPKVCPDWPPRRPWSSPAPGRHEPCFPTSACGNEKVPTPKCSLSPRVRTQQPHVVVNTGPCLHVNRFLKFAYTQPLRGLQGSSKRRRTRGSWRS